MIPLNHIVVFAVLLFAIGLFGTLTRRHVVGILISIELMINAANINFIAFSRYTKASPEVGQIFAVFIVVLAAIAAAVGLAIVVAIYRNQKTIYTDEIDILKW